MAKTKMTEQVKARLQEASAKKRLRQPKAKDYAVDEWLIHLDLAVDEMVQAGKKAEQYDPQPGWENKYHHRRWDNIGITLKYVSDEVIDALAKRLPGVQVKYGVGPERWRITHVFPCHIIFYLLKVMRLLNKDGQTSKYATRWNAASIKSCRRIISK